MSRYDHVQKSDSGFIVIDTRKKWFNIAALLLCFIFLISIKYMVNQPATGDEPHYLIMDYSIVHDKDLSLANNYDHYTPIGGGYYWLSYQGWPHVDAKYANKQYSVHGIGLPIIILPGFFIGKYSGVVFESVLIATFVIFLTWVWTLMITKNRNMAYLASFLLVICYFFNTLAGAVYPDMLMAALTLLVLIWIERYCNQQIHQFFIGLLLGILILVHIKTMVLVIPAIIFLCWKTWKNDRKIPWPTILVTTIFVAYYFFTLHQWFGVWSLSQVEGGQKFNASPKNNLTAMLFDSNRGLLVYNPILLLLFIGLPLWFKKMSNSILLVLFLLGPSILLLLFIPNWNGSASPTGRYIIEFLPAFMPAVVFAVMAMKSMKERIIIAFLSFITLIITIDATFNRFPEINNSILLPRPYLFQQIQQNTGFALDKYLPSYNNYTVLVLTNAYVKLALLYLFITSLIIYGIYLCGYSSRISKYFKK